MVDYKQVAEDATASLAALRQAYSEELSEDPGDWTDEQVLHLLHSGHVLVRSMAALGWQEPEITT